jgi:C_GCAxxG_C_C family probable redox protein
MNNYYGVLKELKKNDFQDIYNLAFEYEQTYLGCGQCMLGAFTKLLGVDESVYAASTAFAGGIGLMGDACGPYIAGVMLLGYFFGRGFKDLDGKRETGIGKYRNALALTREYREQYLKKFGSLSCPGVQKKMFGRSYNLMDRENDFIEFEKAGAHTEKCPSVVGECSKMVAEIIYNEFKKNN